MSTYSQITAVQPDPAGGFQKEGANFNCWWVTLQGQDNGNFKMFTKAGSKMDTELTSGTAIGRSLYYELSAKGNLTKTSLDQPKQPYNGGGSGGGRSTNSYSNNDPKRQASIIRQSCLKAAVESLGAGKSTQEYINRTVEFEQFVAQAGGGEAATTSPQAPSSPSANPQMQMEAPQPPMNAIPNPATEVSPF